MNGDGRLLLTRRSLLGFTLAAAFGGATLLVSGCGDEKKSAANGTEASSTGSGTGSVALRLGFFPNVTHAAALYGTGSGLFAKVLGNSATIEERVFTAGPAEIEALFAREVDLGYIGPGPALNGYLKSSGEALKIVAGASSGGAALVARGDVAIKSVADLAGKRVAIPQKGGTQDLSLHHAIQTARLAPKDKGGNVDILEFAPADTLTQFKLKSIDAAWLPEPWVSRLEQEAGAKVVADERSLWTGGQFSTTVVIVRSEFLKQHPEVVEKFLAAHIASVDAINADKEAATKVIGERIAALNNGKAIPPAVLKSALARTEITADPLKETVLTFADWSKEAGYLRQDRTALAGLIDEAPLTAARKLAPTAVADKGAAAK